MGLGKTIQALALILARPSVNRRCKTTLIIAPLALLQQWHKEILAKVKGEYGIRVIIFHGTSKRHMGIQHLLTYDVVLCTYGKLAFEYKTRYEQNKPEAVTILNPRAKFHRVILDEAHNIKNKTAKASLAAAAIQAEFRWCMTGTPFMNRPAEIFPLIRFLEISPYDRWDRFSEEIDRPLQKWSGDLGATAMRKLQTVIRSITLRRTKDSLLDGRPVIELPARIEADAHTEFDAEQMEFYLALERQQKLKFNRYLKEGTVLKNYIYILVLLLRLRQACDHPHLIKNHGSPEGTTLTTDEMLEVAVGFDNDAVRRIEAQSGLGCPLCVDPPEDPIGNRILISPCGHHMCPECYAREMVRRRQDGVDGEPAVINCPGNGCPEKVTPTNVTMYTFFVDAHMGGVGDGSYDRNNDDAQSEDIESDEDGEAMGGRVGASGGLFLTQSPQPRRWANESEDSEEDISESFILEGREDEQEAQAEEDEQPDLDVLRYGRMVSPKIERDTPLFSQVTRFTAAKGTVDDPIDLDDDDEEDEVPTSGATVFDQARPQVVKSKGQVGFNDIMSYDGCGSQVPTTSRYRLLPQDEQTDLYDTEDYDMGGSDPSPDLSRQNFPEQQVYGSPGPADRDLLQLLGEESKDADGIPNYDGAGAPGSSSQHDRVKRFHQNVNMSRNGSPAVTIKREREQSGDTVMLHKRARSSTAHDNFTRPRRSIGSLPRQDNYNSPAPRTQLNTPSTTSGPRSQAQTPGIRFGPANRNSSIANARGSHNVGRFRVPPLQDICDIPEDQVPDFDATPPRDLGPDPQDGQERGQTMDPDEIIPSMEQRRQNNGNSVARPSSSRPHNNSPANFLSLGKMRRKASKSAAAMHRYRTRLRHEFVSSAKIDKILELISTIRARRPREKTLIFSLWTSFLDLLEVPIEATKIGYTRYDGAMRPEHRDAAVKNFMENPDVDIMLVSLTAGNAGLNLTAACQVILSGKCLKSPFCFAFRSFVFSLHVVAVLVFSNLCLSALIHPLPIKSSKRKSQIADDILAFATDADSSLAEPFWNPFTEEQAIDRAHRIGQTREVTVHRVLINETVEDRILALQAKKKALVGAALSEEGASFAGQLTVDELQALFGV